VERGHLAARRQIVADVSQSGGSGAALVANDAG